MPAAILPPNLKGDGPASTSAQVPRHQASGFSVLRSDRECESLLLRWVVSNNILSWPPVYHEHVLTPKLRQGIFEFLTGDGGPLKPTAYISHPSWAVGIPNTLLCFEMAAVSILHLYAYPYSIYKDPAAPKNTGNNAGDEDGQGTDQNSATRIIPVRSREVWPQQPETAYGGVGTEEQNACGVWDGADGSTRPTAETSVPARGFQWRALKDALNFVDIVRAVVGASRWLVVERRRAARGSGAGEIRMQSENGIEYMERTRTDDLSEALNLVNSQARR